MTAFEKVKYGAFFPSEGKKISQKEEGKNMAVKWTAEQQKVIDARDRNLLVSAAAGSGKTAVLAGMYADGITSVTEPVLSRNHTEIMLNYFGANVTSQGTTASIEPEPVLNGQIGRAHV